VAQGRGSSLHSHSAASLHAAVSPGFKRPADEGPLGIDSAPIPAQRDTALAVMGPLHSLPFSELVEHRQVSRRWVIIVDLDKGEGPATVCCTVST